MRRYAIIIFLTALLQGCASDPMHTTGERRPTIADYKTVRVLSTVPLGAQRIAVVKASSDSGFSRRRDLDHAVGELKKRAAKVGANALVITRRATSAEMGTASTSGGGTIVTSNEVEFVRGIAIWVD